MRWLILVALVIAVVFVASRWLDRGTGLVYAQIACSDVNGDASLNAADALNPSRLPDFNGDGRHDTADAAFLRGVDIPLDGAGEKIACAHKNPNVGPEWAVVSPGTRDLTCARPAVLILGVGGGVTNLKQNDAAGVRQTIEDLATAFHHRNVQTLTVLSGQAVNSASSPDPAMETWDSHATQVFLDAYPCLRLAIVGHSHGAITGDIVAWKLEGAYGDRIIEVVNIDRVEALYGGDTVDWPARVHVLNIYETNDKLHGGAHDAANVTNWDASGQRGPNNSPVIHTTIDNSSSVRAVIIADILKRWAGQ